MTGYTDSHRQGTVPQQHHVRDSHQTETWTATSPPPLGLAEEGQSCSTHTTFSRFTTKCTSDWIPPPLTNTTGP